MITILTGNVLDTLPTLPANSVQCCVTSPPYWGLRDYGTGTWEGGDAACDHVQRMARGDAGRVSTDDRPGNINPTPVNTPIQYRDTCGKCGARRIDQQLGSEATPQEYVANMVAVFREVRRILREDGVLFLNLGDSYVNKQLGMIPARVALALQDDGWILRSEITWCKKAPMPESVTDRPTSATEKIFLLTKSARYFYDAEAVKEASVDPEGTAARYALPFNVGEKELNGGGRPNGAHNTAGMKEWAGTRNQRNFWLLGPEPYAEAHFATFPTEIPRRAILAGTSAHGACPSCGAPWERVVETSGEWRAQHEREGKHNGEVYRRNPGGGIKGPNTHRETTERGWQPSCTCGCTDTVPCVVLDPFTGSGTTGAVARTLGRDFIGCELNESYVALARRRIEAAQPPLFGI